MLTKLENNENKCEQNLSKAAITWSVIKWGRVGVVPELLHTHKWRGRDLWPVHMWTDHAVTGLGSREQPATTYGSMPFLDHSIVVWGQSRAGCHVDGHFGPLAHAADPQLRPALDCLQTGPDTSMVDFFGSKPDCI